MAILVDLKQSSEIEKSFSPQLPPIVLSQVADDLKEPEYLVVSVNGKILNGVGTNLSNGLILVKGNLGRWTGNGMSGGYLYVKGNVDRISNVDNGMIYVDGNIDLLINIKSPARIFCTGEIGGHLFGCKKSTPSIYIFGIRVPCNQKSFEIKDFKDFSSNLHYLVKVNKCSNIPRVKINRRIRESMENVSNYLCKKVKISI